VRDVSCGACACTPSIRSQLPAGGGTLSLASLAVLALAPNSAVGADGGAPARSPAPPATKCPRQTAARAPALFRLLAGVKHRTTRFLSSHATLCPSSLRRDCCQESDVECEYVSFSKLLCCDAAFCQFSETQFFEKGWVINVLEVIIITLK
jgi:hypothetical protein